MISFWVRAREEIQRRFSFFVVAVSSIRDMPRGQHSSAILTPLLHHRERNTVQHSATQRNETSLDVRD
jgi:hypothetical protein